MEPEALPDGPLPGPAAVPLSWIVISLVIGTFLMFAPWSPPLWDSNWLLQRLRPGLRAPLLSPFVRGAVTGLGLVNVVLALHDAYERLVSDRS
jgi:hypothetical protein